MERRQDSARGVTAPLVQAKAVHSGDVDRVCSGLNPGHSPVPSRGHEAVLSERVLIAVRASKKAKPWLRRCSIGADPIAKPNPRMTYTVSESELVKINEESRHKSLRHALAPTARGR